MTIPTPPAERARRYNRGLRAISGSCHKAKEAIVL